MTWRTAVNSRPERSSPTMSRVMLAPSCLLLAVALSCATTGSRSPVSHRAVEVDGRMVPVEELAKETYDEALEKRREGEKVAARALLEEVRREYADASWADHATVALAQLHLDDREPGEAQRLLEGLLLDDPTSGAADQARYLLALAQLAQGDTASAAPTLKNLVDRMPTDDDKKQAALQLAEQLHQQGQGGEAARYLSRAMALSDDQQERQELEERLLALVDSRISFADVRRLKETEAEPGSVLDELLTFKLARVHVHLRDYPSAAEAAATYLERYPQGRFAKQAQDLSRRLKDRVQVQPRTVGVVLPLSGQYAVYGQRALTAIKLGLGLPVDRGDYFKRNERPEEPPEAVDPTNPDYRPPAEETAVEKDLSVNATPRGSRHGALRLVVRDSNNDPQRAQDLMRELVEKEHAIAVIGDILLDTSLPVALKAEEYGVPTVSLSRRDGIPRVGPWVFRMSFTAEKQAAALVDLAMETMGHRRFAILYPRHSYGLELMNAFWSEVERRQGEVTAVESYSHDQTTFTTEAKSLVGRLHLEARGEFHACRSEAVQVKDPYRRKKAFERCRDAVSPLVDFDAIFIPDDYRTVSYIVPALAAEDILLTSDRFAVAAYEKTTKAKRPRPVQLLGGNMWNNEELARRLARQIDGAVVVDGFDSGDGTEKVKSFVSAFVGVHRSQPGMMEAQAFDAAHLLFAILDGVSGAPPKTRAQLREHLARAKDFPGVTGLVQFDDEGDSATPPRYFLFERDRIERAKREDFQREGDG